MVLILQDPSPESCPKRQITPPLGSGSEPTDAPSSLAPVGGVGGCERVETTRGLWGNRRQRMSASWHPEGQELPAGAGQVHLPLCTFPQIRDQTRMRNFLATFVECLEV